MTAPALLIGFVIASIYGSAFHLWRGGQMARLLVYLVLGWAGFWAGHFLGEYLGWHFLGLGPLNMGVATIGSAIFLLVGHWLSLVDGKNP